MTLYHLHKRKRLSGKAYFSFPAPSWALRLLDNIILGVGVVAPAMMIPQIYLIYSTHNATGLSPISWLAFTAFDIPWIIYGLAHKEKPIVTAYTLWFFSNGAVFIGALLY